MLTILIGPPLSGKSTWAKEFIKNNENYIRLNRDDIRIMMRNNLNVGVGGEYIITEMLSNCIQNALRQNVNVILDEVNCKLNYIEKYIFYFNKLTDIQFVYFDIPLQELKKRNTIRALETKTQPIPEKVIENAYNSFQDLKKQFNFELIKKIET